MRDDAQVTVDVWSCSVMDQFSCCRRCFNCLWWLCNVCSAVFLLVCFYNSSIRNLSAQGHFRASFWVSFYMDIDGHCTAFLTLDVKSCWLHFYNCDILQLCVVLVILMYSGGSLGMRCYLMLFYFGILEVGVRWRFLPVSSGSKKQRSKPVIVAKSSSLGLYPSF